MTIHPSRAGRDEARAAILMHSLRPLPKLRAITAARYLVKGLLERGAVSVVYGASNVGKSFLALDLALHVTAGEAWFGCKVAPGAGPAVYVCAEGTAAFANRVEAVRRTRPDLVRRAAGMQVMTGALDLCGGEDAANLCDTLDGADCAPSLIVIDTLARSMGAGDENSAADVAKMLRSVATVQERTGAHVMLIHHSGKDVARGMRGHSALRGAVDTEIELTRPEGGGGVVTVAARKQRDLAIGDPVHFRLRPVWIGNDEDGDPVTSAVVEQAEAPEAGRGALAFNEDRKREAAGRADAAMRLLPADRDFAASDVADAFAEAEIVKASDPKSVRESTRAKLNSMAKTGLVTKLDGGLFRISKGGRA